MEGVKRRLPLEFSNRPSSSKCDQLWASIWRFGFSGSSFRPQFAIAHQTRIRTLTYTSSISVVAFSEELPSNLYLSHQSRSESDVLMHWDPQ